MSAPMSKGPLSGTKLKGGMKQGQMQTFTPEQLELFQSLFGHLGPDSFLAKLAGGDQSTFGEIEAPAIRQFGELQSGLASKFSGMGLGARRSSGFQNTSNQAASDFAQDLQSKRQEMRRQAIQDLMGLSNDLLGQRPYENYAYESSKKKNPWGSILGAGIGGLGGFAVGGPAGAFQGANMGYGVGSQF